MENHDVQILPHLPADITAARVPQWDLGSLVPRACPACDSDRHEAICMRPDGLKVVRCGNCGMAFLPLIPSAAQVETFYRGYGQFKNYVPPRLSWFQNRVRAQSDPYLKILDDTGGLRGKSLLEIGCSFGNFLQGAKLKGAQVSGVELDQAALRHVAGLGIPAVRRMEESSGLRDIVCAFQVIEHLPQPGAFVQAVAERLVDDGRLLLSLPNGGAWEEAGPSWIGFRIDLEHFNYFSARTLGRLLAQHQLYVEHVWTHDQPFLPRQRDAPSRSKPGFGPRVLSKILSGIQRAARAPNRSDGNFVLTVLARKTAPRSLAIDPHPEAAGH